MTCMRYLCDKLHMFTVGDGCAKLSLAKRLSIRVLILRYGSLSLCLFAQLWVPAANLGVKIGGGGNFWSSGPKVD